METTESYPCGIGKRDCCRGTILSARGGSNLSYAAPRSLYWGERAAGLRRGGAAGGRALGAADDGGLRQRGCLSPLADPLDVVACAWRTGNRDWWPHLSSSPGCRL